MTEGANVGVCQGNATARASACVCVVYTYVYVCVLKSTRKTLRNICVCVCVRARTVNACDTHTCLQSFKPPHPLFPNRLPPPMLALVPHPTHPPTHPPYPPTQPPTQPPTHPPAHPATHPHPPTHPGSRPQLPRQQLQTHGVHVRRADGGAAAQGLGRVLVGGVRRAQNTHTRADTQPHTCTKEGGRAGTGEGGSRDDWRA